MSRIVGVCEICSPESKEIALLEDVRLMIRMCQSPSFHTNKILTSRESSFGWAGWSSPNVHQKEDLMAIVDGRFYNREELPEGMNDAERFLEMYAKDGFETALQRINGDFAIALYDERNKSLWLGRDRFGLKPLYYSKRGSGVAFASRPKALWFLQGFSWEVNPSYVARIAGSHYRYFDHFLDQSPFRGIDQLPAAHWLRWHDGELRVGRYWELREQPEFRQSEIELARQYRELLGDSVQRRLQQSPKAAFTLSGGMDSSSVLASAVFPSKKKQVAFSSVYSDKTFDESEDISSALSELVSNWYPIRTEYPSMTEAIKEVLRAHDEPIATATWLAHFTLAREVRERGFASLFGGMGGDELNAGEYEYFFYFFADLRRDGKEKELREEVDAWGRHHDHPIYRKNWHIMERTLSEVVDFSGSGIIKPLSARLNRYIQAINPDFFDLASFSPVMEHPFQSFLKNRTYQDLTRETAPCCLRAEDRNATHWGIDHFLPFFDHRLVEFMYRIPGEFKIRSGVTKWLLREAMKGILPEATRTRIKKTGWNAPAHVWFSRDRNDELWDLVRSRAFRERGIYRLDEVERIIREHENIVGEGFPVDNHMMFLWQLMNVELWLQEFHRDKMANPYDD